MNRKLIDMINAKQYRIEAERLEEALTSFGFEYDGIYVNKTKLKIPENRLGVFMEVIIDPNKGKVKVLSQTKVKNRDVKTQMEFDFYKSLSSDIYDYIIDELKKQIKGKINESE